MFASANVWPEIKRAESKCLGIDMNRLSVMDENQLLPRVRNIGLRSKIMAAEETISLFRDGMYLGFSGFAEGHPKTVPGLLADHVEKNGLAGRLRFNVFTGASIGSDLDNRWSRLRMIDRRWPHQHGETIRLAINEGAVSFGDRHLSMFAQDFGYGFYTRENRGRIDLGIIEASCITEDGGIVPTLAIGIVAEIIARADRLVIEINTKIPSFEGMHDCLGFVAPPDKRPYPILQVGDRIGSTSIPCDPGKIVAIVESWKDPVGRPLGPTDDKAGLIAGHIIHFLKQEVQSGRLPAELPPLQSGVGTIANAVFGGLLHSSFSNLNVWTEVFQDNLMDLFDAGKLNHVSAASFSLSQAGLKRLFENWERYTSRTVLRPIQISNHPELIRRLGLIAMNTPIEFDIYAHVNSTLVNGSRMLNGIGGSGEFMRSAYLSIMHTPSTRPSRNDPHGISCVVPMVTHVDHTEHDMDILVTEQGLADLRGLAPKERAQCIIDRCAHPEYKPVLQEYLDRATRECLARASGHEPHMLYKVFNMQRHLEEHGTMKVANWD